MELTELKDRITVTIPPNRKLESDATLSIENELSRHVPDFGNFAELVSYCLDSKITVSEKDGILSGLPGQSEPDTTLDPTQERGQGGDSGTDIAEEIDGCMSLFKTKKNPERPLNSERG